MARRRERRTYSLAIETGPKLVEIAQQVQGEIAEVPVHAGIVIDVLAREATKESVMQAMGLRLATPEPTHG